VQNCTKNILTRVVNPEYNRLGDEYYTPDVILATWFQAESGRIPVSGSGYGGPFCGPGFDSMWTDMSEIVRPTRDGIHGREYINTSVDIGRKLPYLVLADGQLTVTPPPLLETPLPVIFEIIPEHWLRGPVAMAVVEAAEHLGTLAVVRGRDITPQVASHRSHVVPLLETTQGGTGVSPVPRRTTGETPVPPDAQKVPVTFSGATGSYPMVMIPDGPDVMAAAASLKQENAQRIVVIRVQASPAAAQRAVALTRGGAEVIHLVFDSHGREDVGLGIGDWGLEVGDWGLGIGAVNARPPPPVTRHPSSAAAHTSTQPVSNARTESRIVWSPTDHPEIVRRA
jgi:hypothetical protein